MPAPGPWLVGGKGRRGLEEGVHQSPRRRLWLYQEKNLSTSLLVLSCMRQIVRFHFISRDNSVGSDWCVFRRKVGFWIRGPASVCRCTVLGRGLQTQTPSCPANIRSPWLLTFWAWVAFLLLPSLGLALRSWGQDNSSPGLLGCRLV